MRTYTRIIFGLNAFYQIVMGVVCMVAPMTAVTLHGGTETDLCSTLLMIAFRIIGVNMVPAGVISAVVAADPDKRPILRTLMGMIATLQLICWGIVIGMHDLSAANIASMLLDVVVQVALLVAVVGYYPRSVVQQVVVRRRNSLAA
jgi:hypothetical protein